MHVVILACDARLGAIVKDRFDRNRVALTEVIPDPNPSVIDRLARTASPSIVLLVCRRPDHEVMALCRRAGGYAAATGAPFVAAVDEAGDADRTAILDAGADAVVSPVDVAAIERRIHAARGVADRFTTFISPDLVVDAAADVAVVRGRPVPLTPHEAEILRVLLHHRPGAVSRSELECRLPGGLAPRALGVSVASLRRKLGPLGARIETVRRVGYAYVERR